jgi:hypothetical protein
MEVTNMFSRRSTRRTLIALLTAALLLTACNAGATPAPTLDVNAMSTALVGTTVAQIAAQFTQTALSAPTNTAVPAEIQSTPTIASLPTLDLSGAASPTVDAAALPTFSFVNTPVTSVDTPVAGATQVVVLPTSQAPATTALGDACNNLAFEGDVTVPDGETIKPGTNFQKIWAVRNTGTCLWDDGYALVYIAGSKPDLDPYNFEFKKSNDFVKGGAGVNIAINLTTPCAPGKYEGHWRMRNDKGYYFGSILSVYVTVVEKCK